MRWIPRFFARFPVEFHAERKNRGLSQRRLGSCNIIHAFPPGWRPSLVLLIKSKFKVRGVRGVRAADRGGEPGGWSIPADGDCFSPKPALKLTSYSLSFRPFFHAILASPAPPLVGISFCMRISLHQPFSARPHPLPEAEYLQPEIRWISD